MNYDRVANKGYERLKEGDYKKTGEYTPSRSELLLEQICESFGTKFLQAYVNPTNGTKLVRESKPTVVKHINGERKVLQFQYTRFSPLYSQRHIEVYNENRAREKGKRKIPIESVSKEIYGQYENWDAFKEVTYNQYINNLHLFRWEKELYFAVYNVNDINRADLEEKLEPFLINEYIDFNGKLPEVHITFKIEPCFYAIERAETIDTIYINFPQTDTEHGSCISSALSLHPLDRLSQPREAFKRDNRRFGEVFKVKSSVPRELTMGFITNYLRKFCLGKNFY